MATIADEAKRQEKALRLVEFLERMASLRTRLIRDVDEYQHVLWLASVPESQGCYTPALGTDAEYESDIWLEVHSAREPKLPVPPSACAEWYDHEMLTNKSQAPELRLEITVQRGIADHPGEDVQRYVQETLQLANYPEVSRAWQSYVANQWQPWVEQHNAWMAVHEVYSALFSIQQSLLRAREEYELVLAMGLLTWRTPSGQTVRRHLAVADCLLEFEANLGRFLIRPSTDGARLRPEFDMLDVEHQPEGATQLAGRSLSAAADDPWRLDCIARSLSEIVHSIDPGGEYLHVIAPDARTPIDTPVVELAPAIILRRRSDRGLLDVLRHIRAQIESGDDIPPQFGDLAELDSDEHEDESETDAVSTPYWQRELFFPKPANDQQRQIAEKLERTRGVVVQGPPGTGKSHSIANLICHFLAQGKRVLVTAKTPRALHVLQNLVPPEVLPLCVSLLGTGQEERQSLERSVRTILSTQDEWNETEATRKKKRLNEQLLQLRQERAALENKMRLLYESESYRRTVVPGAYEGTPASIARRVEQEAPIYGWLHDPIPHNASCPLSVAEFQNTVQALRRLTTTRREELALDWFSPHDLGLLAPEEYANLVATEHNLHTESDRLLQGASSVVAAAVQELKLDQIEHLQDLLSSIQQQSNSLLRLPFPWVTNAVRDVLGDSVSFWQELFSTSSEMLATIRPLVSAVGSTDVLLPSSKPSQMLAHAEELRNHLARGGRLGWGPFRPHAVKNALYLLNAARLNGRQCTTLSDVDLLVKVLKMENAFAILADYWAGHYELPPGPYPLRFSTLKDLVSALSDVLKLSGYKQDLRIYTADMSYFIEPDWEKKSDIECHIHTMEYARVTCLAREATDRLDAGLQPLDEIALRDKPHPVISDLANAIRERNPQNYSRAYDALQALDEDCASFSDASVVLEEIRAHAPGLAQAVEDTVSADYWSSRCRDFQAAWNWAQARTWLEQYVGDDESQSLSDRLCQIDIEINGAVAHLAAMRAWSYCFGRLRDDHRRHMLAWQQAMKRFGKGTGRHAPYWRRVAQEHLNECRGAVPAWVMPLHRVWDTVAPEAGMFDIVIVDEASQCGFEALPLLYIGAKVLIVGDDKQISPDAVGLPRDAVQRLMREYLYDFEFRSTFDVESSLFEHGKLRYGTRQITLREHFRSMPEIIRFSNDLCYQDTPLIPLRQYGPSRLPPLKSVYLSHGYREGSNNHAINPPEADAVAAEIARLCANPAYEGKTMGVVVLQGMAQASLIENRLLELIGAKEIESRRIVCGNPYSFQGDERDIIFLSMVAAPNRRIGAFTAAADERRFNVAASRARDQMWLFHSAQSEELSAGCLRRRLVEFFQSAPTPTISGVDLGELEGHAANDNRGILRPPRPFESWFEVDVALALARRGFALTPQFEVAGKRIDLVVEGGQSRVAVECDGDAWHGIEQYEADAQRQRVLERCGWVFYRVRECAFYSNREDCLERLQKALDSRGVAPVADKGADGLFKQDMTQTSKVDPEATPAPPTQEVANEPVVEVGNTVVYVDLSTSYESQVLISNGRSDPNLGVVNVNTPFAQALLGAQANQKVLARLPMGEVSLFVKEILKQ